MTFLPFEDGIEVRRRRRNVDPDTSHEAARATKGLAEAHQAEILAVLNDAAAPLTARAIAERCSLDHVAIGKRMCELVRAGLAQDSGQRHVLTTGRKAIAWEIA